MSDRYPTVIYKDNIYVIISKGGKHKVKQFYVKKNDEIK